MPGQTLKKRREELGQNLKDIAHSLRIRYDYLKALEDEDFGKLPVPVYTKGYIRDYAKFLNVDPEPVIRSYTEKISPPLPEKPAQAADAGKPAKPKAKKYFLVAVIISVIAAAYFLVSTLPRKPEIAPQKITLPAPAVPPEKIEQPVTQPQDETAVQEKIVPGKKHELEIRAEETTWLLVTIDDTESKEMLLNPGDSVNFSADKGFSLKIGNAGGIKLFIDGKDLGKPGKKGEVISLSLPEEKAAAGETQNRKPD